LGNGGNQLVRKLPAKRRPDLRHLAHRREAVEPGQERGLQARRDGKLSVLSSGCTV
jgi:hypothetical protein